MAGLGALLILAGCDSAGNVAENLDTIADRNISAVSGPPDVAQLEPVSRVPRAQFGVVPNEDFVNADGQVTATAAAALFFPDINQSELAAIGLGLDFFTTVHTAAEGLGPVNNQTRCLGCHKNTQELANLPDGLVSTDTQAARAARATPTNFNFTAGDVAHGGRAADHLDAINDTGDTAAFTIFGDFDPATGAFISLSEFGGAVQHTRPSLPACIPDFILPEAIDPYLPSGAVGEGGIRRAVGERAGPPYIGRGLMEAVFAGDIAALEDPDDLAGHTSSLDDPTFTGCINDCVAGRHNENTVNLPVGGDPVIRLSRFGLRAAGPTILQFVLGGTFGELGFTNPFFPQEPGNPPNTTNPSCQDTVGDPDIIEDVPFSVRNMIRMTAPPELGDPLLTVLNDPAGTFPAGSSEAMVQRGAQLFGVDLEAFANRMIPGRMPAGGDGLDANAINQADRQLNCVGCHTPIIHTGTSPSEVGARLLSNKWAHFFSDMLIHDMGEVTVERQASTPRNPVLIQRPDTFNTGDMIDSFDLSRSLADDALPGQALAAGDEWRTPPLWGVGRTSPPFLHDARVYLSNLTVDTTPASTVFSTNATGDDAAEAMIINRPFVVRTQADGLRATIELHDLPWPDAQINAGANDGCPVPPGNRAGAIVETEADICPPFGDPQRSEAQEVIRRWRRLNAADQQALIEFLKQL
jgi:hypothetical protein